MAMIAICLLAAATHAGASPQDVYRHALQNAAAGNPALARAELEGAAGATAAGDPWQQRLQLAAILLAMREQHDTTLPPLPGLALQQQLMAGYTTAHPAPEQTPAWLPATLGLLLPGAGHAWLGRWHDAAVAALLVLPMLGLTVWAGMRRMGPVTVFFALITIWLWSGTVFSAWSLAERGSTEQYLLWWQGLWETSGLPGRPW